MDTALNNDLIRRVSANPEQARLELDRLDCEERLIDYCKWAWPLLEPGREMRVGWALEAMCDALEAITAGHLNGRGLLINVPPGLMKSLLVNVFWPSWEWGPQNMAWLRYLSLSYSEKLTLRDNKKFRAVIKSEEYKAFWGDRVQIAADEDNFEKVGNVKQGWKRAGSTMGFIMGDRGDRVCIDDPNNTAKADSEANLDHVVMVFSEVLPTRINDERSVFIVIMQRVHERDVSGHILANELDYEHLMLPMEFDPERKCYIHFDGFEFEDPRTEENQLLFPERFNRKQVEKLKKELMAQGDDFAVAGQLEQNPTLRGGASFKRDDFDIVDVCPPLMGKPVRGWDLAGTKKKKSKRTAGVKIGRAKDGRYVIMHAVCEKTTTGQAKALVEGTAETDDETQRTRVSVPKDPGQAGVAQKVDYTELLEGYDVEVTPEDGSKEERAELLAAQVEAGNVVLLRGKWNSAFIDELVKFPKGTFSDQVDAASRAYAALKRKRPQQVPGKPKIIKAE